MSKVLNINDAYFKIPDKCKDDFGCATTLCGVILEGMNEIYINTEITDFLADDKQECLLSCDVVDDGMDLLRVQNEVPRYTEERC